MKIVHLVGYYIPELGYQENYLAEEHARMGHDVHVVTSNKVYPFPNAVEIMRQAGARLDSRKLKAGISKVNDVTIHRLPSLVEYSDFILLKGLKKKLREIKPDVVFAHESRQSPPYYAGLWKKELGYTLVTDQHDFHHKIPGHNLFLKLLRELDYIAVRNPMVYFSLLRSDAVVAVTKETRDYLCRTFRLPKDMVKLVELGVDTKNYIFSSSARKSLRKKIGLKENDVAFFFAGTIVRRKGIELLIDAFARILPKEKHARLVIIGDGEKPYMDELKEKCLKAGMGKKAIFTGFIPKQKLKDYFSACDAGVWPGNNSVIIMEAMACSLPIIMVDLQLSHLVGFGNGFSFAEGDLEALAGHMRKLMSQKTRKEMGRKSRLAVEKNYSYKSKAAEFLEIARHAMKQNRK